MFLTCGECKTNRFTIKELTLEFKPSNIYTVLVCDSCGFEYYIFIK